MSDDKRAAAIIQDFDAFPEFQNWKSYAENIAIYCEERKSGMLGGRTPGQIDSTRIFDTTVREAAEVFSSGTVSNLTPQTERWAEITPQDFVTSKEQDTFYNAASDRVRIRLGQSNFYRGFHEGMHSGGLFGTMCVSMVPSKKKMFNFQEVPFGLYRFREDGDGMPDTVFREYEPMTVMQIQDLFRAEIESGDAVLTDKMKECLASDSAEKKNEKFTIIHRVAPRDPKLVAEGVTIPSKRPYESVYVIKEENHTLFDNDGFYYQVYIVGRLMKSRHDAGMGRSPGTQIFPSVRMLNRAMRDVGVAVEKTVRPPILEPKDSAFQIDDRPGGRIPFDPHLGDGGKPQPFYENPNIQFAEFYINKLTQQIRSAFFNDLFKFFTERDVATTEKTAFETQMQADEQLKLFTPIFLNISEEVLSRIIENVFKEMFIRGDFNDLMEENNLDEDSIGGFSVVYNSRIALAVRTQRIQGGLKLANIAQLVDQFAPGAGARAVKWEEFLGAVAVDSTIPAEFVNDEEVISQLKQRDDQIAQLQQMVEMAQQAGQAASGFASAEAQTQG